MSFAEPFPTFITQVTDYYISGQQNVELSVDSKSPLKLESDKQTKCNALKDCSLKVKALCS